MRIVRGQLHFKKLDKVVKIQILLDFHDFLFG